MREEALADIVAEMRTRSREVKEAFGGRPDGVENMLDIWADRIEAAWKRQEKTYLDQIRDAMNMWGHEKHIAEHAQKPTVGNAAAMREALVGIRALIADEPDGTPMIDEMKTTIEAALSAPARNCDKMPDIDNLTMHDLAKSPCKSTLEYASREELLALVRWLLALETEQEGVSC